MSRIGEHGLLGAGVTAVGLAFSLGLTLPPGVVGQGAPDPLAPFYLATSPSTRAEAARSIVASGAAFEVLYEGLRRGPAYSDAVPRGRMEPTLVGADGHLHRYTLLVPETYDSTRSWPVRVFLHGATNYPARGPGGDWWPELDLVGGEDHITILPLAWDECLWWQYGQIEAVTHMLSSVKRLYNVDENRVHLLGVSDGGAGVYFMAAHHPTPWASFVPMIGNPQVLQNPLYRPDGHTHAPNLLDRPFFVVNTKDDTTHPPSVIRPAIDRYRKIGVRLEYHELGGGHDLTWWPQVSPDMERFLEANARDPHPDTVAWITDRGDRYTRADWVVLEELGPADGDAAARRLAHFEDDRSDSAVLAVRTGNWFDVRTHRVRRLRILVSPDVVDLAEPVRVTLNGDDVFEGVLTPDTEVLLRWAAADFDRSMLFAAEIELTPRSR